MAVGVERISLGAGESGGRHGEQSDAIQGVVERRRSAFAPETGKRYVRQPLDRRVASLLAMTDRGDSAPK